MSKPIRLLLIWIILFLLAGLILHYREIFVGNVIEPIALVIWALWNLVSSIDQRLWWGGVIVLSLMITLRLIPSSGAYLHNPAYSYESCPQSQFDFWQAMINSSDRNRLRSALKDLVLKVMAESSQYQSPDIDEVNLSSTSLSAETQAYLLEPGRKRTFFQGSPRLWLQYFVSGKFLGQGRSDIKKELDLINEIIHWMETELDIGYGQST